MNSDVGNLKRPVRVLIVDDDPQNRQLLEEVCRIEGLEVHAAVDGEQALDIAAALGLDLVLLDVAMPGLDGLEVCRRLKEQGATAGVPVMVVTARLEEQVRDRATELGASAVVTKPFHIFDLTQRMRAVLRKHHSEPPSGPQAALRRARVDALAALGPPSALRARLSREIETCAREGRQVVCATIRLEEEPSLSAAIGRSATDALLGGAAMRLCELVDDRSVMRGDIDELVVVLPEEKLPAMASVAGQVVGEGRASLGRPLPLDISVRWGALIAGPSGIDADGLLAGARAAVDRARQIGQPGAIDRATPSLPPPSAG
jgi:PleD family two-component response regulator